MADESEDEVDQIALLSHLWFRGRRRNKRRRCFWTHDAIQKRIMTSANIGVLFNSNDTGSQTLSAVFLYSHDSMDSWRTAVMVHRAPRRAEINNKF